MGKIYALIGVLCFSASLQAGLLDTRAGFSRVEIRTPEGMALAGYGGGARRNWSWPKNRWHLFLKPSTSVHDAPASKALYFTDGKKKLVFVSVDLVASSRRLRRAVAESLQDLGFDESEIILTATHTHSGPGLFADELLWEIVAADLFNPLFFKSLVEDISRSIREAHATSRRALFGWSQAPLIGSTRNRRLNIDQPVLVTFFSFKELTGKPIATVLNFPMHGTLMGLTNHEMTGDIPAAVERAFEKVSHAPTLFINGAEGDVSPIYNGANFQEMESRANVIANKLLPFWKLIPHLPLATLEFGEGNWDLGPTQINLLACKKGLPGLLTLKSPLPLRTSTRVGWVQMNSHLVAWIPGEPTTDVGLRVELLARSLAKPITFSVFGLTNDHISYIVSPEEYLAGGYESCSSLYGRYIAEDLLGALDQSLRIHF